MNSPAAGIRIDDYLFAEWEHPRKADVVSKVIGDFTGSDNLAAYAKAFPRFLGALNRPQQVFNAGWHTAAEPQPMAWHGHPGHEHHGQDARATSRVRVGASGAGPRHHANFG
jgi:hypothetical protein